MFLQTNKEESIEKERSYFPHCSRRLFMINNRGEVRIRDLEFLNSTTSHLVVVATDDGVPPRKSTALVEVKFPEEAVVLGSVLAPKKDEGSFILMIVFGALLGSLLLIIITLTVYILKK